MTIKELSQETGIPLNTLYSITKRDSERVDTVVLYRIAEVLGVETSELDGSFKGRGKKLKNLREFLEISQEELSVRTGIAVSQIRKYENGEQEITPKTWRVIEDKLHYAPGELESICDWDVDIEEELKISILQYFDLLNEYGKYEANRRMEELTLIPRYQAPQSALPNSGETDAAPPPDTPERPQEGEEGGR